MAKLQRRIFLGILLAVILSAPPLLGQSAGGHTVTSGSLIKATASAALVRDITSPIGIALRLIPGQDTLLLHALQEDVGGGSFEVIGADGGAFQFSLNAEFVRVRAGGSPLDIITSDTNARTISITCVDDAFNLVPTFTIDLNGALVSATSTQKCRHINLARVTDTGFQQVSNAGQIVIENDKGKILAVIETGEGETAASMQAVPSSQNWVLVGGVVGPESNQTVEIVIKFIQDCTRQTQPFSSVLTLFRRKGLEGNVPFVLPAPGFLPGGSCFWTEAKGAGMTSISLELGFFRVTK